MNDLPVHANTDIFDRQHLSYFLLTGQLIPNGPRGQRYASRISLVYLSGQLVRILRGATPVRLQGQIHLTTIRIQGVLHEFPNECGGFLIHIVYEAFKYRLRVELKAPLRGNIRSITSWPNHDRCVRPFHVRNWHPPVAMTKRTSHKVTGTLCLIDNPLTPVL